MTKRSDQTYLYRNRRIHIPDGHLAVGNIVGVHGLRGELKVESHTDFPERFAAGGNLMLGDNLLPVVIESSRPHKGHILVKLTGINDRNQADELRSQWLFIAEQSAAELDEDSFWIHDIIGLSVETTDGHALGVVSDVLSTGANDVYVVRPANSVNRGRDILLPAIQSVIEKVDLDNSLLLVHVPPGLIDDF